MFSKYLSTTEFLDVIRDSKHQYFALQTANDTFGGPSYLFSLVKLLKFLQIRASECCSTFFFKFFKFRQRIASDVIKM